MVCEHEVAEGRHSPRCTFPNTASRGCRNTILEAVWQHGGERGNELPVLVRVWTRFEDFIVAMQFDVDDDACDRPASIARILPVHQAHSTLEYRKTKPIVPITALQASTDPKNACKLCIPAPENMLWPSRHPVMVAGSTLLVWSMMTGPKVSP